MNSGPAASSSAGPEDGAALCAVPMSASFLPPAPAGGASVPPAGAPGGAADSVLPDEILPPTLVSSLLLPLSSAPLASDAEPPGPLEIGLTVLPGLGSSILSILLVGHDSIEVAYEHPLVRFFTMREASELRLVHPELVVAVGVTRFSSGSSISCGRSNGSIRRREFPLDDLERRWRPSYKSYGVVCSRIASWRACFPAAECLNLRSKSALTDALACARAGALAGILALDTSRFSIAPPNIAEGCLDLSLALPCFAALTTLEIGVSCFCDRAASAFAEALPGLKRLTSLQIHDGFFDEPGIFALAGALHHLQALKRLTLSLQCSLSKRDAFGTLLLALPSLPLLAELSLGGLIFASQHNAQGFAAALPHLTSLTALDVSENRWLGDTAVSTFAPALVHLVELKELRLRNNGLGAESATALMAALPRLQNLALIDLLDNSKITDNLLFSAIQAAARRRGCRID